MDWFVDSYGDIHGHYAYHTYISCMHGPNECISYIHDVYKCHIHTIHVLPQCNAWVAECNNEHEWVHNTPEIFATFFDLVIYWLLDSKRAISGINGVD